MRILNSSHYVIRFTFSNTKSSRRRATNESRIFPGRKHHRSHRRAKAGTGHGRGADPRGGKRRLRVGSQDSHQRLQAHSRARGRGDGGRSRPGMHDAGRHAGRGVHSDALRRVSLLRARRGQPLSAQKGAAGLGQRRRLRGVYAFAGAQRAPAGRRHHVCRGRGAARYAWHVGARAAIGARARTGTHAGAGERPRHRCGAGGHRRSGDAEGVRRGARLRLRIRRVPAGIRREPGRDPHRSRHGRRG